MRCKLSKAFAKPLGLLLLLINALLVVRPQVTKAQEKLPPATTEATEYICPAKFGDAIDAVINRPQFRRSRWGILIESLSPNSKLPNRTLYSRDAEKYFIPASNVKLLTSAAALHRLGAVFKIRTSVYSAVISGNNSASLYILGRGDPSFSDTQLRQLAQQLKRRGISQIQQLIAQDDYFKGPAINPSWEWEDAQANYGAPANSLILNQNAATLTLLPQTPGQPLKVSWADPLAATQWLVENNSVTAEPASPSSVEVTGDLGKPVLRIRGVLPAGTQPVSVSVAVLDPAALFLRHFLRALAVEGITVAQAFVASNPQPSAQELAAVESPSLATLLVETNQNSNNLYAEALLRTVGSLKNGQDARSTSAGSTSAGSTSAGSTSVGSTSANTTSGGSTSAGSTSAGSTSAGSTSANTTSAPTLKTTVEAGLAVVKQTLTELGVDPESYVLADGSGLSRHNLVTPQALVQTLRAVAQTPEASIYRASLPVAGKSGTLRNRFLNTPAQGILQGKTGTMSGVSALSGYLDAPGYQPLVFSILVNQSDQSAATIRQAIDEIVLLMTRLHRC